MSVATALVFSNEPPHAEVQLEESVPASELVEICDGLHRADKAAERKVKLATSATAIFAFAACASFMLGMALDSGVPVVISLLLAALTAVLLVVASRARKVDVDDPKLDVVHAIASVLGPEMKRKTNMRVSLDFRGYDRDPPVEPAAASHKAPTPARTVFKKKWLQMSFTLLDGTRVRLEAESLCKRRVKSKPKYTKKKDKVVDFLSLTIEPPKNAPIQADAAAEITSRVRSSGRKLGLALVGCQARSSKTRLRFKTRVATRTLLRRGWSGSDLDELLDGRKVLGATLLGFRAVRACSSGSAQSRAR